MWVRIVLFLIIFFNSVQLKSQRPSIEVLPQEKYNSKTQWSCIDKHFGYYYFYVGKPLLNSNSQENFRNSWNFDIGYLYRYKIIKITDIGIELGFNRDKLGISENNLNIFDPSEHFHEIYTISNNIHTGAFIRTNFYSKDYRNLGLFFDLGIFFNFSIFTFTIYENNNANISERIKLKNPDYLNKNTLGVFMRFGWNNFAFYFALRNNLWIEDFNNNYDFNRSSLNLGFTFNLYRK